jgi:hypothetical protein
VPETPAQSSRLHRRWKGKPVSVQARAGCREHDRLRRLIQLGCKKLIRVGTCGGLQIRHALGDLIVALSAVPADSTAMHLVGNEPHCPTASWSLLHEAVHVAKHTGIRTTSARSSPASLLAGRGRRPLGVPRPGRDGGRRSSPSPRSGRGGRLPAHHQHLVTQGAFTRISDEDRGWQWTDDAARPDVAIADH